MSAVWDLRLSSTEKLVLLALADCANDEGECWPSIATIGKKACIGERSVQRSIQALKDAGHLSRQEVPGRGCRYRLHPRHSVTPATVSPVTNTTPPPPQCHPTPATVAPKPSMNRKEPSKDANASKARDGSDCLAVVEAWNAMARNSGLSTCAKLTGKRLKSCQARLQSDGLAAIQQAIEHIPKSRFLMGQTGNWSASIDWLLKPDSVIQILEGKYDDRPRHNRQTASNDEIQNPYVRAAIARQNRSAAAVGG